MNRHIRDAEKARRLEAKLKRVTTPETGEHEIETMLPLRYVVRGLFILRNNRKVNGEWGVYTPDVLVAPTGVYLWDLPYEQWDDLMDWTKRVATVRMDTDASSVVVLCGSLPSGVTVYTVGRAINGLDG